MKKYIFLQLFVLCVLKGFGQDTSNFTDERDGKVYKTVQIGNQIWFAENLNYEMPFGWCIECETYGRVYAYQAAIQSCPSGWHLPSEAEWNELTDFAGGRSVVGGNLKETGTEHWKAPNTGATNKSGFTALPHGYRSLNGILNFENKIGLWWSSSKDIKFPMIATSLRLDYNKSEVSYVQSDMNVGLSVRCIKN